MTLPSLRKWKAPAGRNAKGLVAGVPGPQRALRLGFKTERGKRREWLHVRADRAGQGLCKQRLYLCALLGNRVQNRQGWEGRERDEAQSGGKRWEEEGEEEKIL